MNGKNLYYLTIAIFLLPGHLWAQRYTRLITLKANRSKLKYTPFSRIEVLDNRADTTRFFTYDSAHAPVDIKFDRPASLVIRDYMEKAIAPLNRGDGSLLLNIRQLGATNVSDVPHRIGKKKKTVWMSATRKWLQFTVDAWLQTGDGLWRKIGSADYSPYSSYVGFTMSEDITWCLNRLLVAAGHTDDRRGTRHSGFRYAKDTASVSFREIDQPATERWKSYPVMGNPPSEKGYFSSLEDFRDLLIIPDGTKLIYDGKDSVYRSARSISFQRWSLIADSGNLYVRVGDSTYLKLVPRAGKLFFYVPHSLPNMHNLMSIARAEDLDHGASHGKGNLLAALGGAVVAGMINDARTNAAVKKAKGPGSADDFRDCYIDLDSGDIIY